MALLSDIVDTFVWADYSGTRVGSSLILTLGDFDASGTGTELVVDDDSQQIELNATNISIDGNTSILAGHTLTVDNKLALLAKELSDDTTTAYELVLGDANNIVTMNNVGANTLTIPANASVAFPIGTEIVIINKGAGTTTVAITTDTLNHNVGGLTLAQYDKRTLIKITATSWIMGN